MCVFDIPLRVEMGLEMCGGGEVVYDELLPGSDCGEGRVFGRTAAHGELIFLFFFFPIYVVGESALHPIPPQLWQKTAASICSFLFVFRHDLLPFPSRSKSDGLNNMSRSYFKNATFVFIITDILPRIFRPRPNGDVSDGDDVDTSPTDPPVPTHTRPSHDPQRLIKQTYSVIVTLPQDKERKITRKWHISEFHISIHMYSRPLFGMAYAC